jgi:hypothetical protein
MSGDCLERRFLVVEIYAYWRLPAPAVVIAEIVTASASVRTSGVFGTGHQVPDPRRGGEKRDLRIFLLDTLRRDA